MPLMFDSKQFSRDLKIEKSNFLDHQPVNHPNLDNHLLGLKSFVLNSLHNDTLKKAFWLNVYNALTNTIIIKKRIRRSMMKNPSVFFLPKFEVGKYRFSLDDIEHGILRKNTRAPYKPWPQFWFNDQRKDHMVDRIDHRIHFALNCGAVSCPSIAYYSAENLDVELELAEEQFAQEEFIVREKEKLLEVSMIFKSYRSDFDCTYLNDPKYSGYTVKVRPYNWQVS